MCMHHGRVLLLFERVFIKLPKSLFPKLSLFERESYKEKQKTRRRFIAFWFVRMRIICHSPSRHVFAPSRKPRRNYGEDIIRANINFVRIKRKDTCWFFFVFFFQKEKDSNKLKKLKVKINPFLLFTKKKINLEAQTKRSVSSLPTFFFSRRRK